jgi:hypothetical protein
MSLSLSISFCNRIIDFNLFQFYRFLIRDLFCLTAFTVPRNIYFAFVSDEEKENLKVWSTCISKRGGQFKFLKMILNFLKIFTIECFKKLSSLLTNYSQNSFSNLSLRVYSAKRKFCLFFDIYSETVKDRGYRNSLKRSVKVKFPSSAA